ncbi:thermonuclease family protein [Agrobacterium vaccinii]|uniref:thermonuclease family protein n=1 Tax=Agrobacterium vaccinii TaxID=2735528 RepID=UPI001E5FB472|nr:thermonuclease family protein [Agrobacterium vaccinii]UHS56821.1 thermonuclease family protein [Agrobacterium vaccinii]
MLKFVVFALIAAFLGSSVSATEIVGRASVIDGDTIEINGIRIRFHGVDAPESRQTCLSASGKNYRCGQTSAAALDAFLAKSRPTACTPTGKSYDRTVGVCRSADGQDVSGWMVRNGHAVDWPKYSGGRYTAEQQSVEAAQVGLWSGRFQMPCEVRGARCD